MLGEIYISRTAFALRVKTMNKIEDNIYSNVISLHFSQPWRDIGAREICKVMG
jgi:hypothetical protein